jgi:Amt family ammonium transporter
MVAGLWLILCGVGALVARVGMAIHHAGSVRSKNSAGIMLRSAADLCVVSLAFWGVGAAILFPELDGTRSMLNTSLLFGTPPAFESGSIFFYLCITLMGCAVMCGVAAERSRLAPMLLAALFLGGFIMPVAGRWIGTGGWLYERGFHDFAAASMVHLVGGVAAAVAAVAVGPRMGKYNKDGSSNGIPGHSVPLASAGLFVMLIGWFGYVAGFAHDVDAGQVALNILLAGAAGGLAGLVLCQVRYGKSDVHLTYSGMMGALVAISPAVDLASGRAAVLIGAGAALLVVSATLSIDLFLKIDDATGAISIHAVGAAFGLAATGLLGPADSFADRLRATGVQLLGVAVCGGMTVLAGSVIFLTLKRLVGLRSKEADEYDGLDLAEHDIGAYPDFQQTMIKSYHLREA